MTGLYTPAKGSLNQALLFRRRQEYVAARRSLDHRVRLAWTRARTANLRTNIMDFRGFDWLKKNRDIKGWHYHVHRGLPGKFESSNLSRGNVCREIGRMQPCTPVIVYSSKCSTAVNSTVHEARDVVLCLTVEIWYRLCWDVDGATKRKEAARAPPGCPRMAGAA